MLAFWESLRESGSAHIKRADEPGPEDFAALEPALRASEAHARLDAPGDAPAFDLEVAQWAAGMLYRSAQLLVFREIPTTVVQSAFLMLDPPRKTNLVEPSTAPAVTPSTVWSVDLAFRHLPGLLRLAKGLSEGDPLVTGLRRLAQHWPLSSVGAKDLEAPAAERLDSIFAHPTLLGMYVDRVIEFKDLSRLSDPRTKNAVRAALGQNFSDEFRVTSDE